MERLPLVEHFQNGLRNRPRTNAPHMFVSNGMRSTEYGQLVPKAVVANDAKTPAFPFPQIARLSKDKYVFDASKMYVNGAEVAPISMVPGGAYTEDTQNKTSAFSNTLHTIPHTFTTTPASVSYRMKISFADYVNGGTTYASAGSFYVKAVKNGVTTYLAGTNTARIPVEEGGIEFDFKVNNATHDTEVSVVTVGFLGTSVLKYAVLPQSYAGPLTRQYKFTSFGDVWFGLNNKYLLVHSPLTRSVDSVWNTYYQDISSGLQIGSMCAHNGQLLVGGFVATNALYATEQWLQLWQNWVEFNDVELTHRDMVMGPNVVMYSKRAGGDYWSPFSVELAMLGIPDADAMTSAMPFILDSIRKRELGFFVVPTQGTITDMVSVPKGVLIFCSDGIYQATQPEGYAGYIATRISDQIAERVHEQNGLVHFITRSRKLYRLSDTLELVNETAALTTLGSYFVMNYDAEEAELYITDGVQGLVRTRTGMTNIPDMVLSFVRDDDDLLGYVQYPEGYTASTYVCNFITETLDFGERQLKDIHDVELGAQNISNIMCRIHFRTTENPAWRVSPWFLVKEGGFTTPIVSGHDLRLEIKYTRTNGDAQIEYANIQWRKGDKRNFRLHGRRF